MLCSGLFSWLRVTRRASLGRSCLPSSGVLQVKEIAKTVDERRTPPRALGRCIRGFLKAFRRETAREFELSVPRLMDCEASVLVIKHHSQPPPLPYHISDDVSDIGTWGGGTKPSLESYHKSVSSNSTSKCYFINQSFSLFLVYEPQTG